MSCKWRFPFWLTEGLCSHLPNPTASWSCDRFLWVICENHFVHNFFHFFKKCSRIVLGRSFCSKLSKSFFISSLSFVFCRWNFFLPFKAGVLNLHTFNISWRFFENVFFFFWSKSNIGCPTASCSTCTLCTLLCHSSCGSTSRHIASSMLKTLWNDCPFFSMLFRFVSDSKSEPSRLLCLSAVFGWLYKMIAHVIHVCFVLKLNKKMF